MEELRRSLNAGARDQAPILTSSPVLGDLVGDIGAWDRGSGRMYGSIREALA